MKSDDDGKQNFPDNPVTVVGGQPGRNQPPSDKITAAEAVIALASQSSEAKELFLSDPIEFAKGCGIGLSETEERMFQAATPLRMETILRSVSGSATVSRRIANGCIIVAVGGILALIAAPNFMTLGHRMEPFYDMTVESICASSPERQEDINEALMRNRVDLCFIAKRIAGPAIDEKGSFQLVAPFMIINQKITLDTEAYVCQLPPAISTEKPAGGFNKDCSFEEACVSEGFFYMLNKIPFEENERFEITIEFRKKE